VEWTKAADELSIVGEVAYLPLYIELLERRATQLTGGGVTRHIRSELYLHSCFPGQGWLIFTDTVESATCHAKRDRRSRTASHQKLHMGVLLRNGH
jgi:hypothetical protein